MGHASTAYQSCVLYNSLYRKGEILVDLKQQLQQDLQDAMRAQDQQRVTALRMLIAAVEQAQEEMGKQAFDSLDPENEDMQPDRQQEVSNQDVKEIIHNEVQQRREAIDGFRAGGQIERAEQEETEIAILEEYLEKL
jgi:uncharacterized protein YqeY